jgi:hypothetical protein
MMLVLLPTMSLFSSYLAASGCANTWCNTLTHTGITSPLWPCGVPYLLPAAGLLLPGSPCGPPAAVRPPLGPSAQKPTLSKTHAAAAAARGRSSCAACRQQQGRHRAALRGLAGCSRPVGEDAHRWGGWARLVIYGGLTGWVEHVPVIAERVSGLHAAVKVSGGS